MNYEWKKGDNYIMFKNRMCRKARIEKKTLSYYTLLIITLKMFLEAWPILLLISNVYNYFVIIK